MHTQPFSLLSSSPVQRSVEGKSPRTRGRFSLPIILMTTDPPKSVCGGSLYLRDTTLGSASRPSRWLTPFVCVCVPFSACIYVYPVLVLRNVWVKFHACRAAKKLINVVVHACVCLCECAGTHSRRRRISFVVWMLLKCQVAKRLNLTPHG